MCVILRGILCIKYNKIPGSCDIDRMSGAAARHLSSTFCACGVSFSLIYKIDDHLVTYNYIYEIAAARKPKSSYVYVI